MSYPRTSSGRILAARRSPVAAPVPRGVGLHFAGASAPAGATIDLTQGLGGIVRDQADLEKCVGRALASGCWVLNRGAGDMPSDSAIWTLARVHERARADVPLTNVGVNPADAVGGIMQWGILSERSPAIPAGANDELTYEERRELAGAPLPDDGIVTIVPDQIDASLAAGCPVAYGQEVMPSYDGYDGSGIYTTGVGEKSQGSHEQLIVGAGPGYYLVLNSWGAAWGRGGFAMIDRSFFWGPNAWELFSVRKAPVVRYP